MRNTFEKREATRTIVCNCVHFRRRMKDVKMCNKKEHVMR